MAQALARRFPTLSLALLLLCPMLLRAPLLRAQEAPSPDAPPPASDAPSQPESAGHPSETLHLNANLVDAYFSVRDKTSFVTNLTKPDCQVYDDRQLQTIRNLTQEKNLPLTIGILLDTSGSQQRVLPLEQQSGARFLKDVLTPPQGLEDEAFLISFDVNVDLLSDYTNSASDLTRAINHASINAASASAGLPGIGGGPFPTANPRGTLLYDAVTLAAQKLQSQSGRKVLVLLTDGGDQGSQETLKSAEEAAQKANTILYVILITDTFGGGFGSAFSAKPQMQQLARETGGRVIDVGNNGRKLEAAFTQLQDELRSQYLLSYTPTSKQADGKYHKLEITCGQGMTVQARKGYYAIAGYENNDN